MISVNSFDSTDLEIFYVEQLSGKQSPQTNNTPGRPNSKETSGAHAKEIDIISSVASVEPQIVTMNSDSNDSSIPYSYARQDSIDSPSLSDLNHITKFLF